MIGFTIYQTAMFYYYTKYRKPAIKARHREAVDTRLALQPMLLAERDRGYVEQLKKNRDAENELMKDVPEWKTGTFYGTPVYKTAPDSM